MVTNRFQSIGKFDGLEFSEAGARDWQALKSQPYSDLPSDYLEFLSTFDGVSGFFGYVRLYGIHAGSLWDVFSWNTPETWKFAWGPKLKNYFCIGGDAFGAQYAFSIEDGVIGKEVHMLDAHTMDIQFSFECFGEFIDTEFLRICKQPYDTVMVSAHRKFGKLKPDTHLIYSPSLHLGGEENVANLVEMTAATAMVLNGDIYTQLSSAPDDAVPKGVRPYIDGTGRERVRLDFCKP